MIDEAWISNLSKGLGCLIPKEGSHVPSCHEYSIQGLICDCELIELLSLARLGLECEPLVEKYGLAGLRARLERAFENDALSDWAESHGIPALKESAEIIEIERCAHKKKCGDHEECYAQFIYAALAALPKEGSS